MVMEKKQMPRTEDFIEISDKNGFAVAGQPNEYKDRQVEGIN